VKAEDGTYKEKITLPSDTLLCPDEFNEAFTYSVCTMGALLKLQDQAQADYWDNKASEKEAELKAKYPNQDKRPQTTYYRNWKSF